MDGEEAEKLQVLRICLCHMFCWTGPLVNWTVSNLLSIWMYELVLYSNPLDGIASEAYWIFMFNFYMDACSYSNGEEF